jgi:hypothetical protein
MSRFFMVLALFIGLGGRTVACALVPAGTEVEIRLSAKVASDISKLNDKVEAVVIAPVIVENKLCIAPGVKVHGILKEVKSTESKTDQRALLKLEFNELEDASGKKSKINSQLIAVDNARESVDDQGRIAGILASETMSAKMDQEINQLGQHHSGLASFFETIKTVALKEPQPEIVLEPGVEMTLKVTDNLKLEPPPSQSQQEQEKPAFSGDELAALVNAQPFQTKAAKLEKPSDVTNLMFLGSKERIETGFAEAGWTTAAALNQLTALETFRAIAENRGYKESPVSLLMLDSQPPDLVFQKQNNTFAKRHHLRIWQRSDRFLGETVWVCSATHDTGIAFSEENRTFIHKIDPHIDLERTKVIHDLEFSGHVNFLTLVDRPAVPREGSNATGDQLLTDGKMAVLWFH